MKMIVAGSRTITDRRWICDVLDATAHDIAISEIVSGCCRGVDKVGEDWAYQHGIVIARFPADWSLGKKAGPLRNAQMADYGDILVAFWDGDSRGTKSMIDEMSKRGKRVLSFIATKASK